jgi:hypothetical protein
MLLKEIRTELVGSVSSVQARAATSIAFAIGHASASCYSAVVRTLLPVLMGSIERTNTCLRNSITQSAMCFLKNLQVLPSMSDKEVLKSNALEMLMVLIRLSPETPTGNGVIETGTDTTHLVEPNQDPFPATSRTEVFAMLHKFLSHIHIELGAEQGVADERINDEDLLDGFTLKPAAVSVLVDSIHAMGALLSR